LFDLALNPVAMALSGALARSSISIGSIVAEAKGSVLGSTARSNVGTWGEPDAEPRSQTGSQTLLSSTAAAQASESPKINKRAVYGLFTITSTYLFVSMSLDRWASLDVLP